METHPPCFLLCRALNWRSQLSRFQNSRDYKRHLRKRIRYATHTRPEIRKEFDMPPTLSQTIREKATSSDTSIGAVILLHHQYGVQANPSHHKNRHRPGQTLSTRAGCPQTINCFNQYSLVDAARGCRGPEPPFAHVGWQRRRRRPVRRTDHRTAGLSALHNSQEPSGRARAQGAT